MSTSRGKPDEYWRIVGPGPHECASAECLHPGVPVVRSKRHSATNGVIHHKDHNPTNNDPSNLEVKHLACHSRDHMKGVPVLRIGPPANKGMPMSEEQKAKRRGKPPANKGKPSHQSAGGMTRVQIVAELRERGYTGAVSYPVAKLFALLTARRENERGL